ncbi:hypothetical protein UA75_05975 [Actinoalloteichus sp. GBA129-24]|uniref:Uncharacterized protein n=1 Tax=Actinoalloteichus fjordicus TaxID=1612552 RepID=A0AAC9PQP6_9PSEU|nr:hypothetical protein UA74_05970 [Actinoalloteichus fjordicus]APU19219.1 hypothetical protein UA75_05975 [Actinoalloteichus sp. GBA129-24]
MPRQALSGDLHSLVAFVARGVIDTGRRRDDEPGPPRLLRSAPGMRGGKTERLLFGSASSDRLSPQGGDTA